MMMSQVMCTVMGATDDGGDDGEVTNVMMVTVTTGDG